MLQFTFPFFSFSLISPRHHVTSITFATSSLLSPHHHITLSPLHLALILALILILVLILASSLPHPCPCPFPHLCIPLSIPFLGHHICSSLILGLSLLISTLILMYLLYLPFHLCPRSRPLVSSLALITTCSLILEHVLSVFFSHHRHPSLGSLISPYLCFPSCTYTTWSVPSLPLVLISLLL